MKILHICGDYDVFHRNLVVEQNQIGHNTRIFYYTTRNKRNITIDKDSLDFYNSKIRLLRGPVFFRTRIQHVANAFINYYKDCHDFELIHAHMWFSDGELAYEAKKKWGIPYIIAIRNTDIYSWYYWRIPWNKKRGLEIIKNASKIIFLSSTYKKQLIDLIPISISKDIIMKCEIVPNGIDDFWHKNSSIKHREKPGKIIRILTVGNIEVNKNQITVLKAIEKLVSVGYNVEYYIVGNILDKKIGKRLVSSKYSKLIGFRSKEELINIYKKSDIFVMPSIHETFGLVYVEAMSQGLPVIYSKGQGFDGQFDDGEVGYSVDSKNYIDIYNKILKILDDYENISSSCIQASKQFKWKTIAEHYQDIYEKVLTLG